MRRINCFLFFVTLTFRWSVGEEIVSMEVQSYFFPAADDSSRGVLLNDKTLTSEVVEKPDSVLRPKLRMAIEQSTNHNTKPDLKRKSKYHLHLSIEEIENILKQRALAKAAVRNIHLTSAELDMLVEKATLKIPKYFVSKRDVYRALLQEKAQNYQNNMHNEHFNDDKPFAIKRVIRNINMPLLNLKSLQEEHKKYWFDTRKPQPQKEKRDINMDLVKQRSQIGSKRALSLPKFISLNAQESKGVSKKFPAQSTEDVFDDLMQFEDRTFDDSLADQESFPDLSDSNEEATKNYFTSKKANSAKAFAKPQNFKLTARTNTSKIYLPALKPFTEMGLLDDEWFCDGFKFSEEFGNDFRRKKRKTSTEAITKDKLKNLKATTKNEIKKLKQQLKREKTSYLKQKLESKKHSGSKSNIQKVPKPNVKQLIESANSAENAIDHKQQKRSLNKNGISVGKYRSKVAELENWKPADILGLKAGDIPSSLFYSWAQKREKSDFAKTRNKRYFDDQMENVNVNKILDDDQQWKHERDDQPGKLLNTDNKKFNKNISRKQLKIWNNQRKLDTPHNNTAAEVQLKQVETNKLNDLISKAAPDQYDNKEITTETPDMELASTKHIMKSNLTYLERTLRKNKAIPLDLFLKSIKSVFEGVKDFVRNIV